MSENPKHTLESDLDSEGRPSKIEKKGDFSDEDEEERREPVTSLQPMSQIPRIQRYLVAIEYIGTRFSGSQKQLSCRTVVGVLEVTVCHVLAIKSELP